MVNGRATKANILRRLEDTIARAQPGDVVVFYYSGHGSQVRDRNGDELTDGLDEIICPYDMDWDRGTYILDDDLDAIFASLPPGVLLEAFFDCCFWGADARGLEPEPRPELLRRDVRYLPPPFDIAARAEGDEAPRHPPAARLRVLRRAQRHVGRLAGGPAAAEDYIDGRPNGIFTYWGCRFIAENIERVDRLEYTREQLLEDVRGYLHTLGYVADPRAVGAGRAASGDAAAAGGRVGGVGRGRPRVPARAR